MEKEDNTVLETEKNNSMIELEIDGHAIAVEKGTTIWRPVKHWI